MRWLQQYFRGRLLQSIDRELVTKIGAIKAGQAEPATANRYLALIRAILRRAVHEWEWLDRAPKIRLCREAKRRVRWITPDQVQVLLKELPKHQVDVVLFALATGLRQANVIRLEWSQVDLDRRVAWSHADQAKGRRDIHVSLNSTAMDVLKRQIGKRPSRVFTYCGKPIRWANTKAWRTALVRAGIENFRWHDLRHTWASWHVQHGTPLYAVQEMGAWESEGIVRRSFPRPPSGARAVYRDARTTGLQLRVTSSGVKTFSVFRRTKGGQPERITLGRFPDMTVEQARRIAARVNAEIEESASPAGVKRAHKGEPNLSEFFKEYGQRHG